jgi:hypothetical protein
MSFSSRKYYQQQQQQLDLVLEEEEEEGEVEGGGGGGAVHLLDWTPSRKSSLSSQDSHFLTGDNKPRQEGWVNPPPCPGGL